MIYFLIHLHPFFTEMNKLSFIPSEIGLLQNLEFLDLSRFAFLLDCVQK